MAEKKFRTLRGVHDTLPAESPKWQYVERVTREIAESYGYGEIRIPTIERTELFTRSVGETTDVVEKEMYTFPMGKESITLRPEGTAGTTRALLQNGMLNDAFPVKLFYNVSCFRHEAPQAGRLREFHQFGAECFGSASPLQDAELIAMVADILDNLGVKGVELKINSIGCSECRPAYNKKLQEYYQGHYDELCDNCKSRLERNPLRLLDCKEEGCQHIKADAPRIVDHICQECSTHMEGLQSALDGMGVAFTIDPDIVRGLDYYNRTVFEFVTHQIGAQGTVCGGGRYDGLVEELGGPSTPGLGFAIGIERLLMVMEACGAEFPEEANCALYIGSMGSEAARIALSLAYELRKDGFYILCDTMDRSVKAQMKYADKKNAGYSCIIGSNELEKMEMEINNMETGEKIMVKIDPEEVGGFLWGEMQKSIIDGHSHDDLGDMLGNLLDGHNHDHDCGCGNH